MNLPDNHTDIVEYAQDIIDNFASLNLGHHKYRCIKRRRKKTGLEMWLWIAAGVISAFTLSLYILLK